MDSEVFKFNKTYEERLHNLNTILLDTDDNSAFPQVSRIWSIYLELSIEPLGWKALWYISRRCCNELKITFPAIVVVTVEYIEFSDLTANVTVVEVEDVEESNKIPAKVNDVPLKELYITITQDYEGPDFSITAECLDNYRFFYNHLWWPWDEEDSTTENWIELHFMFRLKLFYDMLNGNMHYVTAKTIKLLIEKGKEVYNIIEDIQNELDGVGHDAESVDDPRVVQLIKLTEELDSIKKQLSHWENPELRKSLNADIQNRYNVKGIVIVIPECGITEAAKYFDLASKLGSEGERYKRTTNTLKEALLHYIQGDTIIIAPGLQSVSGNEHLGHNVIIKGLSSKTVPRITDSRSHWCLFESIGEDIVMNNLMIELQSSRTAIAIKGTTFLDSVFFKNTNKNSMSAIIVHSKGTLVAAKCNFEDFNIAILCLKGATLHLMECSFNNNDVCIKVENGSEMVIENCDLSKTTNIPIQFKDDSTTNKCTASAEFFNSVEGIALNSVKFADTQKVVEVL